MLPHAVTSRRLVGLTPAAKIEGENRPPSGEAFRDSNEVDVRSSDAVNGDDRRTLARPEPIRELNFAGAHAPYQVAI
jgi:hypothetical protein